jgi:hypothetical protein
MNLTKWRNATLLIAINGQISLLQFNPVTELVKENPDNNHVGWSLIRCNKFRLIGKPSNHKGFIMYVISGFRRDVDKICALLGCYAA